MSRAKISRRSFIGLGTAALGGGLVAAYSHWIEPEWLELCHQRIELESLPNRIRLLQLSDLHWSSAVSLEFIEAAIALGVSAKPDLICLTGDFITTGERIPLEEYQQILSVLSSYAPTYAVLGNHDGGEWSRGWGGYDTLEPVTQLLQGAGISVLANDWRAEIVGQSEIAVVGTGDLMAGNFAPDKAFYGLDAEQYGLVLLLAHNPDSKDRVAGKPWGLMLSGHTHGGQVVVPLVGPPHVPVEDKGFVAGLNPWRDRWVYTSRGVGNLLGIRFNCRPEVTVLDLV